MNDTQATAPAQKPAPAPLRSYFVAFTGTGPGGPAFGNLVFNVNGPLSFSAIREIEKGLREQNGLYSASVTFFSQVPLVTS